MGYMGFVYNLRNAISYLLNGDHTCMIYNLNVVACLFGRSCGFVVRGPSLGLDRAVVGSRGKTSLPCLELSMSRADRSWQRRDWADIVKRNRYGSPCA